MRQENNITKLNNKLKRATETIKNQKNIQKILLTVLSGGSGFVIFIGPLKNTIESIKGKDILTHREMHLLERTLKLGAGITGFAGYAAFVCPDLFGAEDMELTTRLGYYSALETVNLLLYVLSLLSAGMLGSYVQEKKTNIYGLLLKNKIKDVQEKKQEDNNQSQEEIK